MASIVWKYFSINDKDKTTCICNLCKAVISRGGKSAKTFTTSNMMNHLRKKHPEEFGKESRKTEGGEKRTHTESCGAGSASSSEGRSCKSQATIQEILTRKKLWDINDHRAQELHTRIGEMIALDIQPYSVTEDIGFQRVLKLACPNYSIPSRRYFSEKVVPNIYSKVRDKVQNMVNSAKYISLTSDVWTASTNGTPFLSLTGHWLSETFEQQMAVLRVVPFQGSHTAQRISEELLKAIGTYDLAKSKIV